MKTEKAIISKIDGGEILVLPLLKSECVTCAAGCAKQGSAFPVDNPRNLPIRTGDIVHLKAGAKVQAVQGILSLMVPFAAAVLGFFLAGPVMRLFNAPAGEGVKAVFVLAFLFISALTVFLITRCHPLPGKAEISEVAGGI